MVSAGSPVVIKRAPERLGDYAHQAIQKCVRHILKQEKGVLAQKDPEFVHQMRIGLRRLRTASEVFGFAIALPNAMGERALKRLGKVLGRVRDLDVLQDWFARYVDQTDLKKSEMKVLRTVTRRLKQHRQKYGVQMTKYLHSKAYKRLIKACDRWLKQPKYTSLACLPMTVALPDIQLPMISQLLLHPGWLVVHDTKKTELEQVHALRKRIKGVRYQMELLRTFYGETYKQQISAFKEMQDLLGGLQDQAVLQSFLVEVLGAKWPQKLPSLKKYFRQQHKQLWQRWLVVRQPYLSLTRRNELHQLFLETA
ncbi:CHAD domain-containing protein [Leptothoe spongobia]|uniref:CHAD domain-containing protein n=1 Tax=Leptothoe spongobia TAU-MAC 1115 TaxID=1967444 RepID=A0A947GNK3_9CYAN|nr:CHAD domain-containing protein [Leptothoe spongobia]MBT9316076.1 CHAD domain-containing protein [Leptothoe spongobia TAU-MAC 1115]